MKPAPAIFLILNGLSLPCTTLAVEQDDPFPLLMTGCFEVTFHYVEDGDHDKVYEPVIEKAELIETNPIRIQRTMLLGSFQQKHWSEEWIELEKDIWQQTVHGPYGDFRYQCEGLWEGGQWNCLAGAAAKPRRDKDREYNVLDRFNTLQINPLRYVHMQRNTKIRSDGSIYGREVGWNVYERISDELCELP